MTSLTPAMDAAVAAPNPVIFGAVQIDLPSYTLRVIDGAATVTFNGGNFVGRDPTYGVLDSVNPIDDGFGDQAPALEFTFLPAKDAAAADLANAGMQGCRIRAWLGVLLRTTGVVVADPCLLFDGELDVPTLTIGKAKRQLAYACVSAMERLFANDEGIRLSDGWHQSVFPGETGLANMTGIVKKVYWGVAAPNGAASGGIGGGGDRLVRAVAA